MFVETDGQVLKESREATTQGFVDAPTALGRQKSIERLDRP